MKVLEYLKNHTYEDLHDEFGIKCNLYDDRVVLNYSQIDSPKYDSIADECRGLILSYPDNKILSRSFDRFYNYGEDLNTKKFDILNSIVYEKIDGSLINVYHDGENWEIATRSMAFGEGESLKGNKFRDIFIEALGDEPNKVFKYVNRKFTIIFELVSPETRVVKPYKNKQIYLLDVRNKITGDFLGEEESYFWDIPYHTGWLYPEKYKFKNWDDCLESSKKLPTFDEGYVALSGNWRIKIKNPSYLAISNLRMNGCISDKRISILVILNDYYEYLYYFPEDREYFEPYINAYSKMMNEVDEYWNKYKDIQDKKEFAMMIKDCNSKHILFAMKKGIDKYDYVKNISDNTKERLLKKYLEE